MASAASAESVVGCGDGSGDGARLRAGDRRRRGGIEKKGRDGLGGAQLLAVHTREGWTTRSFGNLHRHVSTGV